MVKTEIHTNNVGGNECSVCGNNKLRGVEITDEKACRCDNCDNFLVHNVEETCLPDEVLIYICSDCISGFNEEFKNLPGAESAWEGLF